jgi:hypothetical protein
MIDNVQRTPAFLRAGMTITAIVNAQNDIISLVARSEIPATPAPPQTLFSDEGLVIAVTTTPNSTITIRTQRVRLSGQIVDEERTFTIAPTAEITRGGRDANVSNIEVGDIAVFKYNSNVIHELSLTERERTLEGVLMDHRPSGEHHGLPILIIEEEEGLQYELRILPATEISRGNVRNLSWGDLRIGDRITADVEYDRLVSIHAVGVRSTVDGRLNEIRITERNTQITLVLGNGETATYIVVPGVHDVYALRIGMDLRIRLDSREVIDIEVRSINQNQATIVLGYIQSIRADRTIVVVEGQGTQARSRTISVPATTGIIRGGTSLNFDGLRVNMNVLIVLTGPQSNIAQSITIFP